jgi:acid phosphatase type 7
MRPALVALLLGAATAPSSAHTSSSPSSASARRLTEVDFRGAFLDVLGAPDGGPEQVSLSLVDDPHSISVRWTTNLSLPSTVQFDTVPGRFSLSAQGNASTYTGIGYASPYIHVATLPALTPGATYYYRLAGPNAAWSDTFTFTGPRGAGSDAGFYPFVMGWTADLGQTNYSNSTIFHLIAAKPDVVSFPGDLSYADSDEPRWDSYHNLIQPLSASVPIMACPGNHELEPTTLPDLWAAYRTYYRGYGSGLGRSTNSPLWYSYEAGPVHVLSLNSFDLYNPGSDQYNFVVRDLAALNRTRTPWLLVQAHAPWLCSNTAHQGDGYLMRDTFDAMLVNASVAAVFSGHVHAAEVCSPTSGGALNPKGYWSVVIGDGGNREGLYTKWTDPQPDWSAFRESQYGHGMLVVLNATHARWDWHRLADAEPVVSYSTIMENPYFL